MRRTLLICLVIAVALSLGCGKREEKQDAQVAAKADAQQTKKIATPAERPYPKEAAPGEKTSSGKSLIVDAVTGEKILSGEIPYSYAYKGITYFFKTEENLELFKKDPEKYIGKTE
jgi:YHS domain-containing protein